MLTRQCLPAILPVLLAMLPWHSARSADWRNLDNAVSEIPSEGYCDQPYLVHNRAGEWVCVMTTGVGREGAQGQHVVSTISTDKGKTWSPPVDIEPADGPEASWVVPFVSKTGRIYAIYTYNADNMRSVKNVEGKEIRRVDTLGKLTMKYSDDGGHSWSAERYHVPMRNFEIDRENVYEGRIQFFWSISKPIVVGSDVYMGMAKIGNFGSGFMQTSEGCVLKSPNLLVEPDPEKVRWKTLPEGDIGILAPEGHVADEHNVVALDDGSLYLTYRTVAGFACQAYSRDRGRSWQSGFLEYSPGGQRVKQPRCLNKVYRFANGKYLLFFHNNGTTTYSNVVKGNRNPTWIAGGVSRDGRMYWTQPEIFLYDDDYFRGISYPDWLEEDGRYFISETQKETARLHEVPASFLTMLWGQFDRHVVSRDHLVLERLGDQCAPGREVKLPSLGHVRDGDSFSMEWAFTTDTLDRPQVLFSNRQKETPPPEHGATRHRGQGLEVALLPDGQIQVILDDVVSRTLHLSGNRVLKPRTRHHLIVTVDADAKVLTLVFDGRLLDGGPEPYGFTRFSPFMSDLNGEWKIAMGSDFGGRIDTFRVYDRYLHTTEAVGNYRATMLPE